ncbi:hypothetical protein DACRYDRAFT_19463 [Dacryopinax primogenitus]|uniref:Regulator of G protein signaling superfamily n=1 Tax=Dacryopinax primogenitus (strain DJM 731) TaxID=1858805 RepID=M5GCG5_DACPD|nr:uncharacterized protein DACRYDRAFT_19463 [Dacryopinax primogenitus]EJU06190.1 hypothetical protein DACRYDRAFT_19463 [Dacryopinax primogenitus]
MAQAGRSSHSSSHMMKTTKRGRPFLKDTLDLFATLVVSLDLTTHRQFFRQIPNSFTTDEACANLANLKFSQSTRGPDPKDPTRIVTTTTTTTFSMSREMAKSMCQHFMDARLIENAGDRQSNIFKDRGTYQVTPKGLHILERFITKNGMTADHLVKVFATQPICMKLLHLERRAEDDDIIISQTPIVDLFRRFAGRQPNYPTTSETNMPPDPAQEHHERAKGIFLQDVTERVDGQKGPQLFRYCFYSPAALDWLCDFSSIVARDEAAELMAHFVRYQLIQYVTDHSSRREDTISFEVKGGPGTSIRALPKAEFICNPKTLYRLTDEGQRTARWNVPSRAGGASGAATAANGGDQSGRPSEDSSEVHATDINYGPGAGPTAGPKGMAAAQEAQAQLQRKGSVAERMNKLDDGSAHDSPKESNTDRLKFILAEPALRSLFRDFLRGNFCEENLSFWLEVEDLKRRFVTSSSASAASAVPTAGKGSQMEKHQDGLIKMAFVIFNTFLAHSSPCELNIDHGLRNELDAYLSNVLSVDGKGFVGKVEPAQTAQFTATQLQNMIRLYERIQNHVFRLMATDSVPKFVKTRQFVQLRQYVQGLEQVDADMRLAVETVGSPPSAPVGVSHEYGDYGEEPAGRTYMTISTAANEKARALATKADAKRVGAGATTAAR